MLEKQKKNCPCCARRAVDVPMLCSDECVQPARLSIAVDISFMIVIRYSIFIRQKYNKCVKSSTVFHFIPINFRKNTPTPGA